MSAIVPAELAVLAPRYMNGRADTGSRRAGPILECFPTSLAREYYPALDSTRSTSD
jgi:hypothetical protein